MEYNKFYLNLSFLLTAFILVLFMGITNIQAFESEKDKTSALEHRIDFGSAYILGQSIKSGAVYLLHRKQSEIKGILQVRQNFRKEIMEDFNLEASAIVDIDPSNPSHD